MMVKWLSANEKDNLPEFATHFIGVGGLILFNFIQNHVFVISFIF